MFFERRPGVIMRVGRNLKCGWGGGVGLSKDGGAINFNGGGAINFNTIELKSILSKPPTITGGATGTFTSADGKTVTVTSGIITSIV